MESILIRTALDEDDGLFLMDEGKFAEASMYYEGKLCKHTAQFGRDHSECLNVKEKLAFSVYAMGSYLEAKKLLEEVIRERESILGDLNPQSIRIYMLMSVLIKKVGNKSEEDLMYEKLRKILDNMDESKDYFALCCLQIAISFLNLLRKSEAERILKDLMQNHGNSSWKDLPLSLLINMVIGRKLLSAGKYFEARSYLEDILKNNSDLCEKEYTLYFVCRMDIALCYCGMEKFFEAQTQLRKILREHTLRYGSMYGHRLNVLDIMADCCIQQEKFGEAKCILEEMLRIEVENYRKENFLYFETSLRIGVSLIHLRKFSDAESLLEELSRKIAQAYGEGSRLFLQVLSLKATFKIVIENYEEAAIILEELLLKQLNVVGKYHSDYLDSKRMLAQTYSLSHKCAESLEILKDVLRLQSSMSTVDHLQCLKTKMLLAIMYMEMEKFAEAETFLKEVVEYLKEKCGEDHMDTIDAMGLLAVTLYRLGKEKEGLLEVYVRKMEVMLRKMDIITTFCVALIKVEEWEIVSNVVEKCVTYFIEILGADHIKTVNNQVRLAKCLSKSRKSAEAREVIYKVLAKLPKVYAQNDVLSLKEVIAYVCKDLCEHEKTIILVKEVLKAYEEDEGNDSEVLPVLVLIANSLSEVGKHAEMKLIVKNGLIRLSKIDFEDDPSYVKIAVDFLRLSLSCESHTRMNLCQKLLSLPHNILGENHASYLMVMELLGHSFLALGEFAKAKTIYLELLKKTKEIHGEGHEHFKRIKNHLLLILQVS